MKRHRLRSACLFAMCLGALLVRSGLGGRSAHAQQPTSPPTASGGLPGTASLQAETPFSPFHIVGVVIDSVTTSPVPNVILSAVRMSTVKKVHGARRRFQNAADSVTTDSAGRFDLVVSGAGGWELTASARRYGTQHLDQHDGYSTAVVLTEAVPRFELEFRLTPASVIEGLVLDEAGEAVRGASIGLVYLPPPTPDEAHRRPQSRGQQITDDRGFYKFAAISPGTYQVRVSAQPWYATSAAGSSMIGGSAFRAGPPRNPGPDPLDVVYPTVWYPGASDPSAATPIVLRGGETQEANFRLLPVPGSHLHIAGPAEILDGERASRPASFPNTYLTRILLDGSEGPPMTPTRTDGHNADIAGLAPGTYLVHQQAPGSNFNSLSTIQVGAGSPLTMDLSEAVPAAIVTVMVGPAADRDSLRVSFRDLESGNTLYAQRVQDSVQPSPRRRGLISNQTPNPNQASDDLPSTAATPVPDRTISLPPGKYEVSLNGIGDLHLAGIDATGATAIGRTVTIGRGTPKLFLHVAPGLGTVSGMVNLKGQPDPGAMVLLVPATLGDPSGLGLSLRDQSNTDGSFEMSGVLPGGYILIAIDHGWDVNWADPATLRRFLMHGVPLDIKPNSDLKQTLEGQSP